MDKEPSGTDNCQNDGAMKIITQRQGRSRRGVCVPLPFVLVFIVSNVV